MFWTSVTGLIALFFFGGHLFLGPILSMIAFLILLSQMIDELLIVAD
jgi:hypothetical protein